MALTVDTMNDVNTALDVTELALKIYAETLEAFTRTTVMEQRVSKKTITSGKSAQFIVVGKADGSDNNVHDGQSGIVTVTETPFTERTIVVGYPIYSAKRLDNWQEEMAHYNTRGLVTNYMGEDLAIQLDVNLMALINVACDNGYNGVTNDASLNLPSAGYTSATEIRLAGTPKEKGTDLMYALYELKSSIRGNDYNGKITAFVAPTEYDSLVLSEILVNSDVTSGNGGLDTGRIGIVGGIEIVESNSVAGANVKATAGWTSLGQTFPADATATNNGALVMGMDAIGMVSLIGLVTDNDTETDRLGATLMTAKYAYGANVLRSELCGRVQKATV